MRSATGGSRPFGRFVAGFWAVDGTEGALLELRLRVVMVPIGRPGLDDASAARILVKIAQDMMNSCQ
jgi:hypothetical protein